MPNIPQATKLTVVWQVEMLGAYLVNMKRIARRPGETTAEALTRYGIKNPALIFEGWPRLEDEAD